ncbi:hypothetical protein GCM10009541_57940 [Micromonospora gifhornensis]|uniref:Uncharacterized protein n=1 Tax=Micromonospora gifhornensis TaxID=84594 RepID=A0ABQ4I6Y5_9ACTN|nr:hypothetical protein Vgi01_03280 [Micromonospora gifhornensis]
MLARITGPVAGTWCRPSTCGRKMSLSSGPRITYFNSQYSTGVLPLAVVRDGAVATRAYESGPPITTVTGQTQKP